MATMSGSASACDTITELPSDVMKNTPMRSPQGDVMRTCIQLPLQLQVRQFRAYIKLAIALYQALLLHRGPLFKLSF
ncbi:hypothetical protein D5086_027916 [Populus alba]|uniref:Uncharacterized protein n=1 Tax=Populus alba TaxID=43335 RepID=A0ACC4AXM8_POPAL